jgi:dolichol kinase
MTTTQPTDRVLPLRKLIHLSGAAFAILYLFATRQTVLILGSIVLVLTIAVEWGRQRWLALERLTEWVIGPALRQGEEAQPTTGIWAMIGILITLLAFSREVAIPAILYAQVGDPAAEIVGRRWGRYRMPSGKSLEGSLGFFSISLIVGLAASQVGRHLGRSYPVARGR